MRTGAVAQARLAAATRSSRRSRPSPPVERTANAKPAAVQDVQIPHGRAHVTMAEQLLHRANVLTVFKQVGRERVAQRILTLPMNRRPRSFATATIPSTANT